MTTYHVSRTAIHNALTMCLWLCCLLTLSQPVHAQSSSLITTYHPPIVATCTQPSVTLNAGTLYANVCTVTSGSLRSISTSTLPPGLIASTTPNSISIVGRPPLGRYQYSISFNDTGAYATTLPTLAAVNVVPAGTYPSGNAVIRCIQKGSGSVGDAPLCQTCVTSSSGRVCDRDDQFNLTNRNPQAPADARVTSVYMDYAPATSNILGYTLTVSHKDSTTVEKQIAYKTQGGSPSFATRANPVIAFNGQLMEADQGRWGGKFTPLALPFFPWGLDFHYTIEWQETPAVKTAAAATPGTTSKLAAALDKSGTVASFPTTVQNAALKDWEVITRLPATEAGITSILLQHRTTGALALWKLKGTSVIARNDFSALPPAGWKAVAAVDLSADGHLEILLQDNNSGVIDVWETEGTTVTAKYPLPAIPPTGWAVKGATTATGDGKPQILLQNAATEALMLWKMDGLQVIAQSLLASTPEPAWKAVLFTDFSGDGVADILLRNDRDGALSLWRVSDMQLTAKSDFTVSIPLSTTIVAAADLTQAGRNGLLLEDRNKGLLTFASTANAK